MINLEEYMLGKGDYKLLPKRDGYRNFIGLIVFFFKTNRRCKRVDGQLRFEITLPIKWL